MTFDRYLDRMPLWVVVGAVLGVAAGLVLGDLTAVLAELGRLYSALMQIAAIPYLISSIMHGLIRVPRGEFATVVRQGIVVYGLLILVTFAFLALIAFAISAETTPALVDATRSDRTGSIIELVVPDNIFRDVSQNVLPAVIVFAFVYGLAMQGQSSTASLLDILSSVKAASVRIWQWVVYLSPFAVFTVTAHVSGTTSFSDMMSISVYVVAVFLGAMVLAFVLVPAILETMAPGVMRVIWPDLRNGLIVALTTSLSVAALPFIQNAVTRYLDHLQVPTEGREAITETTLSLSYPLAQIGNFFILVFVAFAAVFYRIDVAIHDAVLLPIFVFLSGIGSPSTSVDAVGFLVQWLSLPPEAVALYSGMFTLTRYAQVLASVMGFVFVTMGVALLHYRLQSFALTRAATFLFPIVAAVGLTAFVSNFMSASVSRTSFANFMALEVDREANSDLAASPVAGALGAPAETVATASFPAGPAKPGGTVRGASAPHTGEPVAGASSVLARIRRTGTLRVGYNPAAVPFSYVNAAGHLVGFDVEYMHRLADALNVRIAFVPFDWAQLDGMLEADAFDIAAAGISVTEERLQKFVVSRPYYETPAALIVRSSEHGAYLHRSPPIGHDPAPVTVLDDPFMMELARGLLPGREIAVVPTFYGGVPDFDVALWTMEQAWAFALLNRDYTAVRPAHFGGTLLFAYLIPPGGEDFRRYLDYWLVLQRENGFHDRMVEKWIKANPTLERPPRWSVLRNVFGLDP